MMLFILYRAHMGRRADAFYLLRYYRFYDAEDVATSELRYHNTAKVNATLILPPADNDAACMILPLRQVYSPILDTMYSRAYLFHQPLAFGETTIHCRPRRKCLRFYYTISSL